MAYTYEDVIPSLIPNTTMYKKLRDGVHTTYAITPIDGYVLHDNRTDIHEEYDLEGNPIGDLVLGFASGTVTCAANYDFTATPTTITLNGITHNVNKVGAYEFYAIPVDDVPADQIFGGVGNNDHEVM